MNVRNRESGFRGQSAKPLMMGVVRARSYSTGKILKVWDLEGRKNHFDISYRSPWVDDGEAQDWLSFVA